ncbi:hypothetical protein ACFOU2_20590 [Bacillus songklensis]|uniref:Uncharacterized protein n=1 Tax=Bacillus songklensis TaxID=1069116 RepID=A0ABV8B8R8_9BACI
MEKVSEVNNAYNNGENKDLILDLEKQAVAGVWIQTFGLIIEAVSLSKLLLVSEELNTPGERQITLGVWISTIGQLIEAIGASTEISTTDRTIIIEGQKMAITGDWLKSFGAAIEATGGTKVLSEEQQAVRRRPSFVP